MLNAEKYRKEILNNYSGFSVIDSHIDDCESILCESCLFSNSKNDDGYLTCINRKVKWLLSEYKEPIKLTRLEYDILKYLSDNTKYMYIVRDGNGNIFLYDEEPQKSESAPWWTGRGMMKNPKKVRVLLGGLVVACATRACLISYSNSFNGKTVHLH